MNEARGRRDRSEDYQTLLFHLERLAEETKRLATNSQRLAEFNADLSMTSAQSRASLRNLHDIHRAPK